MKYVKVYLRESAGGVSSMVGFTSDQIDEDIYVYDKDGEVAGIVPKDNVALTEFVTVPDEA